MKQLSTVDLESPWLILAPHLLYPTRNGGDISVDRLAKSLSLFASYVDLIATDRICRFKDGKLESETFYTNRHRSKARAALQTIWFNDHYFKQKFNTTSFLNRSKVCLSNTAYKNIFFSYLSTASLVEYSLQQQPNRLHLVFTQNDEFRWFINIQQRTNNPLIGFTALLSRKWLHKLLRKHENNLLLLHVSDEDEAGFRAYYPNHLGVRMSIGVDEQHSLPAVTAVKDSSEGVRLIFVGSLSMKMNVDGLVNFSTTYFPKLRQALPFMVEVVVVGSNPTEEVVSLCQQMGWKLHQNVTDEQLQNLFVNADFSLMPFTYTNGAKLKLLNSLAHGVPFLGTENAGQQLTELPQNCLANNEPQAWVDHIMAVRSRGDFIETDRASLVEFASQYSWDTVTKQLLDRIANFSSKELYSIPPNL